ncbi:apoptosis-antagonizing transcription factor [Russula dissimulans]|nr:apoptosis-antagonizing transcription factor [Russula dissimulans]
MLGGCILMSEVQKGLRNFSRPSVLRHNLDSVTDPKYFGTKTSRKQLQEENPLGTAFADSPERSNSNSPSLSEGSSIEEDEVEEKALSPDEEKGGSEDEQSNLQGNQEAKSHEKELSTTIRQRRDEDRKKGKVVTKQLSLWDSLLDARIRLQKSVTASNQLLLPTSISDFTSHRDCLEARHALLGEALALVEELSALRDELMKEDKQVQWQPRKRRRVQDGTEQGGRYLRQEIDSVDQDWDALIGEASEDAVELEHAFHSHLTHTLEKWSAKVAAVAPSALLPTSHKRFSLAGSTKGVKSVGIQIEDMLRSEWPVLLSRTRRKGFKSPRVTNARGIEDNGTEEDEEVFDDTDFYQQLLRDVIDAKGGGPGQLMDWTATQRQKKSKKMVDTRASKGRKLRYEVHEKLQNFMVPVPLHAGAWHEAQIDELFGSLLGKGFEE